MIMNSNTTTVMRRPSPLAPISLKPQASWANPAESIDLAFPPSLETQRGRFGQLVKYYFWAVKGPALTAYSSIEGKIQDCLSCRDDLFEGEAESALPNSIDCFMVGRTPEKASPCIAVSCESKNYCRKVITIVKETSWWFDFYDKYPAFKFIHLRNRPRPIRKALHHEDGLLVYTKQPLVGSGTIPLFFFKSAPHINKEPRLPDSTMGGIISLDGVPFGLTVAHALHHKPAASNCSYAFDESDRDSTFSFVDDSDNDCFCYSDTIPAESDNIKPGDTELCTAKLETSSSISTESKPSDPTTFKLLGKIVQASEGTQSDEVDWALISFDQGWDIAQHTEALSSDLQPEPLPKMRSTINNLRIVKTVPVYPRLDSAKRISMVSSAGDTIPGLLKPTHTLIGLDGSPQLLATRSILLDRPVESGECGIWIVDPEDNWYGHIVAADPGSNVAYVAPAHTIQRQIKIATGKDVTAVMALTSLTQASAQLDVQGENMAQMIAGLTAIYELGEAEDKTLTRNYLTPTPLVPITNALRFQSTTAPSGKPLSIEEYRKMILGHHVKTPSGISSLALEPRGLQGRSLESDRDNCTTGAIDSNTSRYTGSSSSGYTSSSSSGYRSFSSIFSRSRSKSPRLPPPVDLKMSPAATQPTSQSTETSAAPQEKETHDSSPTGSARYPSKLKTGGASQIRESRIQHRVKHSGTSSGGYGRHANEWLFGGFSITPTVRETILRGVKRMKEDEPTEDGKTENAGKLKDTTHDTESVDDDAPWSLT